METILKVNGMMCTHCKARVEKICCDIPGTIEAVVNLKEKTVTITGNPDINEVTKAITDAGYEVLN